MFITSTKELFHEAISCFFSCVYYMKFRVVLVCKGLHTRLVKGWIHVGFDKVFLPQPTNNLKYIIHVLDNENILKRTYWLIAS